MPTASAETETLLRKAISLHREGRWAQAEPIYREILAATPDHADVLHLSGVLAGQMGRPDAAIRFIRRAIDLDPMRAEYHNSLGNALRAQGDLRAAAAAFEHALILDARSPEILTNLGALM